ncbi:MAG: hypothetical protein IH985_03325 [Planctomycetes bacterium]|nr:hypothetical protein [Planctomycetota bacterium]
MLTRNDRTASAQSSPATDDSGREACTRVEAVEVGGGANTELTTTVADRDATIRELERIKKWVSEDTTMALLRQDVTFERLEEDAALLDWAGRAGHHSIKFKSARDELRHERDAEGQQPADDAPRKAASDHAGVRAQTGGQSAGQARAGCGATAITEKRPGERTPQDEQEVAHG